MLISETVSLMVIPEELQLGMTSCGILCWIVGPFRDKQVGKGVTGNHEKITTVMVDLLGKLDLLATMVVATTVFRNGISDLFLLVQHVFIGPLQQWKCCLLDGNMLMADKGVWSFQKIHVKTSFFICMTFHKCRMYWMIT